MGGIRVALLDKIGRVRASGQSGETFHVEHFVVTRTYVHASN
jgi:hypothetical protein